MIESIILSYTTTTTISTNDKYFHNTIIHMDDIIHIPIWKLHGQQKQRQLKRKE
jgi:hypothetical protein